MAEGLLQLGLRLAIWAQANIAPGYDRSEWRLDAHGRFIRWSDYGNRNSQYGWELDHYPVPKALGGKDTLDNLRALHWRGNSIHGGLLSALLGEPKHHDGLLGLLDKNRTPTYR